MKIRLFAGALALVLATVVVTTAMISPQDEKPAGKLSPQDEKPAGEMSEEEMMKKWMEMNKLTEHHKHMASSAGEWIAVNTHFAPDGSVMAKTTDSSTIEKVLGGRYMLQHYDGSWEDMPFHGMGLFGFDTMKNEYVSVWFDNFSTAPMIARGKPGDDPNVIKTSTPKEKHPFTGQMTKMEMVTTIVSDDEHILEMYEITPQGRRKSMHIKYTRKD